MRTNAAPRIQRPTAVAQAEPPVGTPPVAPATEPPRAPAPLPRRAGHLGSAAELGIRFGTQAVAVVAVLLGACRPAVEVPAKAPIEPSIAEQCADVEKAQSVAHEIKSYCGQVAKILSHPSHRALPLEAKTDVETILKIGLTKPNPGYYADKLLLLLDTKDASGEATSARNDSRTTASLAEAQKAKEEAVDEGIEERAAAAPGRRWTPLKGEGEVTYRVDRSDLTKIVVQLKVHLDGKPADTERIRKLEDLIEKHAATPGYVLDLVFTDQTGADVFRVGVDPAKWPTSHNWISGARSLAHEAHHLLGLPDRYDYIESHAANAHMAMPTRIHWFKVQIQRPSDPEGKNSLMGSGPKPLADDICRVVQAEPIEPCLDARKAVVP